MRTLVGLVLLAALAPLGALALLAGGCREPDQAAPEPSGQAQMAGLLDAARTAARAEAKGKVAWYTRANLFDYIDGQAEEFFDAGFVLLGHTEWKPSDAAGDGYVELDLYDMGSPAGVAKVMPPPPGDKTVELAPGVAAYRDGDLCEFGAGRYYVRIVARRDDGGLKALVDGLAKGVAAKATAPGAR